MILLNALLTAGFAIAAAPVVVHILHRRRVTRLDWGAMRFLHELLAKSRRDIAIDHWLLLLLRIAALALVAFAFTRPALPPAATGTEHITRIGRTAAILLVDDSVSTGTGRGERRLDRMRALAEDYLDSLEDGDEISILRLSQLDQPAPDPVLSRALAGELLDAVEPTAVASDWPALLAAGLRQVPRHINPNVELVLLSDGGSEGWALRARTRWAELRSRLQLDPEAAIGSRERPRLLLLEPPAPADEVNLAVADLRIDRSVIPVDSPVDIQVHLAHHGDRPIEQAQLQILVDDRQVADRECRIAPGGQETLVVRHRFERPGSHVITARIAGSRDALPSDDSRSLAVDVAQGLPVLLVEGEPGTGLEGSLGFTALALDPLTGLPEAGSGAFRIERISAAELGQARLADYRCVVLGDLAGLDNDMVAALENYVVSGGGLLIGLGPQTDPEHVNRFWARSGDGFLPTPIGAVQDSETGSTILTIAERGHPALRAFANDAGKAWSGARVRHFHPLNIEALVGADIGVLLRLSSGEPVLVERRRGLGTVLLYGSSWNLDWSDCCLEPAYVPLLHGLVGHLGGRMLPPRNLQPGQRIAHLGEITGSIRAVADDGRQMPLQPGSWQGRSVLVSEPLAEPGIWSVSDADRLSHYVVEADPREGRGVQIAEGDRDPALGGLGLRAFGERRDLRAALELADVQPQELWQWLLLGAVALLFAETWVARRQRSREGAG